jgi:hypothetical protein
MPDPIPTQFIPWAQPAPRCIGCGYTLHGLPEARCPECGRTFDLRDSRTYTTKPPFVRWRYWLPGFLLALVGGSLLLLFITLFAGFSWAATLALPLAAGALLGYGVRAGWVAKVALAVVLVSGFVCVLMGAGVAGLFCGIIFGCIALVPLLLGALAGFVLRQSLKTSRFDQRWHLPTIFFLLAPLAAAWVDRVTWTPPPVEAARTVAVLNLSIDEAWRNVRFYEQVRAEEPAIFRWRWLGLPRPLYASGTARQPGDRTVCVYDKGRLVKQVVEVSEGPEGRRLAFRVIEQGFERHAMRLVGGSFQFESVDAGHTRVTLETTYVPYLGPRWCWRPAERRTVHALHGHVLAGMAGETRTTAELTQEPESAR